MIINPYRFAESVVFTPNSATDLEVGIQPSISFVNPPLTATQTHTDIQFWTGASWQSLNQGYENPLASNPYTVESMVPENGERQRLKVQFWDAGGNPVSGDHISGEYTFLPP